jgi:hypothetical protein
MDHRGSQGEGFAAISQRESSRPWIHRAVAGMNWPRPAPPSNAVAPSRQRDSCSIWPRNSQYGASMPMWYRASRTTWGLYLLQRLTVLQSQVMPGLIETETTPPKN